MALTILRSARRTSPSSLSFCLIFFGVPSPFFCPSGSPSPGSGPVIPFLGVSPSPGRPRIFWGGGTQGFFPVLLPCLGRSFPGNSGPAIPSPRGGMGAAALPLLPPFQKGVHPAPRFSFFFPSRGPSLQTPISVGPCGGGGVSPGPPVLPFLGGIPLFLGGGSPFSWGPPHFYLGQWALPPLRGG
eukprot:UN2896